MRVVLHDTGPETARTAACGTSDGCKKETAGTATAKAAARGAATARAGSGAGVRAVPRARAANSTVAAPV